MGGFLDSLQRGYTIKDVSKRLGLLYFGVVDYRQDDHEVIRGLTVSTTHRDKHYAVGSYDGYDIAMVDRYDQSKDGTKSIRHNWCIIQISLHAPQSIPHVFVLPHDRSGRFAHLFVGLRHLQVIHDLTEQQYSSEFTDRYNLNAPPHQALEVERWISPSVALGIAARFWPHAIEIRDGKLYVYITEHRLDEAVLGGAIASALWLAEIIDQTAA